MINGPMIPTALETLPHSPIALAAALTDAANDLGLPRHGRIAERTTTADIAWLKKLGIQIRRLP